ncbi:MAG: hypothetical protein QE277_11275 [Flectobacillus sp.]|nr:hypothetical protein [Flectobacillus sp.]
METPEEEDFLLEAFEQLNKQLSNLSEQEKRAVAREQVLAEKQRQFIEEHQKMLVQSNKFHSSVSEIETRMKTYLSSYFERLPRETTVITEKRFTIEQHTKYLLLLVFLVVLLSSVLVYFASPRVDVVRLEYQAQRIRELEDKLDYMERKNPKTSRNYEEEKAAR